MVISMGKDKPMTVRFGRGVQSGHEGQGGDVKIVRRKNDRVVRFVSIVARAELEMDASKNRMSRADRSKDSRNG